MSKLLLDETPLVILPQLATLIGLNEAIFIQQLHYWLNRSKNIVNERKWSYNSYEDLQAQFPFLSLKTIQRTVKNLKAKELILVENHNKDKRDKTNWYSINYEEFEALISGENGDDASGQNDLMGKDNMTVSHQDNMTSCIVGNTETTTETTTEIKNIKKDFTFSLKQNNKYLTLTDEYKAKLKAYAVTKDGAYNFTKFLDHHIAKGSKFADWSRAYNTWLRNAFNFDKFDASRYIRIIPHPTLKNVYAEYGVNNAYDGDKLEFIGSFNTNSSEQVHASPIESGGPNSVPVAEKMMGLANKVRT